MNITKKVTKVFVAVFVMISMFPMMNLVINAESNTEEITLTSDRTEAINVEAGKTLILNLGGFTQTGAIVNNGTLIINGTGNIKVSDTHAITNKGNLTINGGTVDALTHAKAAVYNDFKATATINGGKYLRSDEAGYKTDENSKGFDGGNSWYTIFNHGTMTINDGEFENKGDYSSMIENGWQKGAPVDGVTSKLSITGGKFTSGMHAVKNDSYGELVISGGTFTTSKSGSTLLNWNKAQITGGTFTAQKARTIYVAKGTAGYEDGSLLVTAGTFNAPVGATVFFTSGNVDVSLQGGSYNALLGVDLAKEYKLVVENGRNVVKAKTPKVTLDETAIKVEVGSTKKLSASLEDSIDGSTITWVSSDESVAKVDATGKVTAIKAGNTVVSANNVSDKVSASCTVTVYEIKAPVIPPVDKDTNVSLGEEAKEVLKDVVKDVIENVKTSTSISNETREKLETALDAGKEISVAPKVEVKKESAIEKEVVTKIENAMKATTEKDKVAEVAQYYDLSMMLTAAGEPLGTVNELTGKVEFTVSIPKDLTKAGRKFYMVRVHGNGDTERIEGKLDGTDFSFETDKFSIFALVYEDNKVETPTTPETPAKPTTPTTPEKPSVDTGDVTNAGMLMTMLLAAGFVGFTTLKRRNRI